MDTLYALPVPDIGLRPTMGVRRLMFKGPAGSMCTQIAPSGLLFAALLLEVPLPFSSSCPSS